MGWTDPRTHFWTIGVKTEERVWKQYPEVILVSSRAFKSGGKKTLRGCNNLSG